MNTALTRLIKLRTICSHSLKLHGVEKLQLQWCQRVSSTLTFSSGSALCTSLPTDEACVDDEIKPAPLDSLIESRFYGVKQFGKLELKIPISVSILSLDTQKYPEMNKASIRILYTGDDRDSVSPSKLSALKEMYNLSVDLREETDLTVGMVTTGKDLPLACRIHLPIKFGKKTSIAE